MKSTFSILFYLKRNGQKSNGNVPIMGRITVESIKATMTKIYRELQEKESNV